MPHEVAIDDQRLALDDEVALGRRDDGPLVCVRRLASGDAVVITACDATRDGLPLLGGLGLVAWGTSALVRCGGVRIEIVWRAGTEQRAAVAGQTCGLCFGAFADGEPLVGCVCDVAFHLDCDTVRVECPRCGGPVGTTAGEDVPA